MSIVSRMNALANFYSTEPIKGGWNEERERLKRELSSPCRIMSVSGNKFVDGKIRDEATHRIFIPGTFDIKTSWIVEIYNSYYSIVPPVNNAGGGINHHTEILLKARDIDVKN